MNIGNLLQTGVGGLSIGAIYALVALGFSIVFRTIGLVNFAHGDILMIGAFLTVTFFLNSHLWFPLALVLAVSSTALLGFGFERVLRPLERKDLDLMLIGTIGFGIALEGAAVLIWGSQGQAVPTPINDTPIHLGSVVVRSYDLFMLGVTAAVVAALYVFLERTKTGAAMQAAAMDHEAATAMGIDVARCNGRAFAIGAGLAAVAGALVGPRLYVSVGMGATVGIKGFAAAILGGFGNIPGAIVGGLALGLIESYASGSQGSYSDVITFLVFTGVIMLRPNGLLGERTVSRP
ncbi:MAG: branched-chain amino acid ABC transporter permease [Solirubrobacterales bacterium]|nr:branched-chain amino acid ABC transporter permease [Solirubrobacterales bacterium]MBV9473604.1 branched-chain amino acid ABC transporter permease [Solirubrobacterales bacterium]